MIPATQAALSAIVSFFFVTLIVGFIYFLSQCRKRHRPRNPYAQTNRTRVTRTRPSPVPTELLIDQSASYDPSLEISMAELVRATANFAPDGIIGDGGFGLVYRAMLSNGVIVAAKKLSKDAFQGFREFRAEMDVLGKLRHENIVKILGYSALGSDRVLVYEFMENGSLDQWIYDPPEDYPPLSWTQRNKIVQGVANGLRYLHELETAIIHRDIKASNVLLDGDLNAHIADFGLARTVREYHSHVSTQVAGTMGYMPPEYKEGVTNATVKSDVYSFGILMLEIATVQRPSWPVKMGEIEMGVVQWSRRMVAEGREMDMLDPSLNRCNEKLIESEVENFFRVAGLCTGEIRAERPTMDQVLKYLNEA